MGIRRISGPSAEPVTVEEAKQHLNYDFDDRDDQIGALISAARTHVEDSCHIVVAEALFEYADEGFPDAGIEIPRFPLLDVESLKYDDSDGAEQTVLEADYYVDASGKFGVVYPASSWPTARDRTNSMRVRFTAGYSMASGDEHLMPAWVKQAILLVVGHWFEHRAGVGEGDFREIPLAVEALIAPYRVPVIA